HGTDSPARPSLWHAAPSVASEHSAELLGCPISRSSLRLTLVLNQGPFPPAAFAGLAVLRHSQSPPTAQPVPRGRLVGRSSRPRQRASRVAPILLCLHALANLHADRYEC